MFCKKCGTENPDNFKFCQSCGARLDGKKNCTRCGAEIEEDANFCGFCGKSLNGIKVDPDLSGEPTAEAQTKPWNAYDWKKIVNYIGLGFAAFAAVIGLIFTFCIGTTSAMFEYGISYKSTTYTIYYYFFEAYRVLDGAGVQELIPVAVKTLLCAASLISGITFAIITSVKCVKQFAGKKEGENFAKSAIGGYLSFAIFAAALLAANSSTHTQQELVYTVKYSGVTMAGLVLGGIATGCYFVCNAVVRISEFKNAKVIVNSAIALAIAILSIVVASLLSGSVCSVSASIYGYKDYLNFLAFINLTRHADSDFLTILGVSGSIVGFIIQILLLVFTVKTVYSALSFAAQGKEGKILALAITNTVLALVQLIMAVVFFTVLREWYYDSSVHTASYGMPIAVFILSLVILAGAIVLKVFLSKKSKAEEAEVEEHRF